MIEDFQEEIDSESALANDVEDPRYKKLERLFTAYDAILYVLRNDLKRKSNPSLQRNSIILYRFDDQEIVAAIHAQVEDDEDDEVEIKWVGSIEPGEGRKLIDQALQIAKKRGAKKARLAAKYGSEPFYQKHTDFDKSHNVALACLVEPAKNSKKTFKISYLTC